MTVDFERLRRGDTTIWVRPEWRAVVERDAGRYFDGLEGRAIVGRARHVLYKPDPARPGLFVRRNRRGGLVRFLGGVYFGPGQLLYEMAILHAMPHIPAPRPVGVVVRRSLGVVTDSVSLFEEIDGAREIVPVLREAADRRPLIESAARAVASVARAGVDHPDLNIRNILVRPDGAVFVVDFLGARRREPPISPEPAVARLYRSMTKWLPEGAVTRVDRWRFVASVAGDPTGARRMARACGRGLWRHKMMWAIFGKPKPPP